MPAELAISPAPRAVAGAGLRDGAALPFGALMLAASVGSWAQSVPAEADAAYLALAAREAAALDWTGPDPWHQLTARLKAASGRGGKALFLPLRRALTGLDHGPDMAALLPLIGRERALARLGKTG